jgi:hypothetical protein
VGRDDGDGDGEGEGGIKRGRREGWQEAEERLFKDEGAVAAVLRSSPVGRYCTVPRRFALLP